MQAVVGFAIGFACGWATRSIADSSEGAGVKLLELAQSAKEHVMHWVAQERERIEDMIAEARANAGQGSSNGKPAASEKEKDQT